MLPNRVNHHNPNCNQRCPVKLSLSSSEETRSKGTGALMGVHENGEAFLLKMVVTR